MLRCRSECQVKHVTHTPCCTLMKPKLSNAGRGEQLQIYTINYIQPAMMHFCLALLAVPPFSVGLEATAKKQASKQAASCKLKSHSTARYAAVFSGLLRKVIKLNSRLRQVGSTQLAKIFRF